MPTVAVSIGTVGARIYHSPKEDSGVVGIATASINLFYTFILHSIHTARLARRRGGLALFAAPWGAYPHGTICEVAGRGKGPGASGAGRPRPLHPHARPTEAQLKSRATQSRRGSGAGSARA